ncbi:MAG: hypothetical protein JW818_06485 [Pirellulales bacterium]|nr:hypothetical protein [Pirellulales bacterium]
MIPVLLMLLTIGQVQDVPLDVRYPGAKTVFECTFNPSWDDNFDEWPDGWTRRRGPGFPHYVSIKVRKEPSAVDDHCLRIDLDGGGAVAFSPPISVQWLYSYVLEGAIKTEGLDNDRAYFSLTFLDDKRRRLVSYRTTPVRHTDGWAKFRLGPVTPPEKEVTSVIIGLHLQPQKRPDLRGAAMFSDLWLGRLPRMSLSTSKAHNVFTQDEKVHVVCNASGFSQRNPQIEFQLEDATGHVLAKSRRRLPAHRITASENWSMDKFLDDPSGQAGELRWRPPIQHPGFYRVRAKLAGSEGPTCTRELTLALIESHNMPPGGEFGWSIPNGAGPLPLPLLGRLAGEMGINWIKYPLWFGEQSSEESVDELMQFSERLSTEGIELIGILDNPPPEIRTRFGAGNLFEAADIFTASPKVWYPSLAAVLARLSTRVGWWQLGSDRDTSFVGCLNLNNRLIEIKTEMDRIGQDVNLGVSWNWIDELPELQKQFCPLRFLTLSSTPALTHHELATYLTAIQPENPTPTAGYERPMQHWVTLEPLPKGVYSTETRANDLVRRMIAAKLNGAKGIFASDPFDPKTGLLNPDGTPSELLLVWRTTAMALSGAKYLGSIQLPNGSSNQIFARSKDAVMIIWNNQPIEEVICLGDDIRQNDIWGRTKRPAMQDHRQVIEAGPVPTFVTGLDLALVGWRQSFAFEKSNIPSIFGKRHRNAYQMTNHFSFGASGSVELVMPEIWEVDPKRASFRLADGETHRQPFELLLPYDASSGQHPVRADFEVQADRLYRFSVYRAIDIGIGGVKIEWSMAMTPFGQLEVTQVFYNNTDEPVSFRCQLSAPGRQRQETRIIDLPRGSRVRTYRFDDGQELKGKTLWLHAQEIGGSRRLNYRLVVEQ